MATLTTANAVGQKEQLADIN